MEERVLIRTRCTACGKVLYITPEDDRKQREKCRCQKRRRVRAAALRMAAMTACLLFFCLFLGLLGGMEAGTLDIWPGFCLSALCGGASLVLAALSVAGD